ncbi:MAG: hypothetical protein MZU95_14465 [Desulfomicrobium escambiense]|nr:hypothetical protein [Desulfomicrobium escambiense]
MREAACEMIIDAGDGVRLQGFLLSPAHKAGPWPGDPAPWVGRQRGIHLYPAFGQVSSMIRDYNVFRLNYRDHGNTHHLNEGVFHAILLDEVFNAVKAASGLEEALQGVFLWVSPWAATSHCRIATEML